MKWILCDDEPSQLHNLHMIVKEYALSHDLPVEILEYDSCNNLLWDLESGLQPDLLLLDIQMNSPDALSGMELARQMRNKGMTCTICFITGIADYVYEGYDVAAAGYILKPYTQEKVFSLLDRVNLTINKHYSIIQSGREIYRIEHDNVIALEASGRETIVYQTKEDIRLHLGLTEAVEQLAITSLFKIHRSYFVHLGHVERIDKNTCLMDDGRSFPIARGMKEPIIQEFIRYNMKGSK